MEKTFDSPLQEFQGDLFGRHIEVPQNVAEDFLNANIKRVLLTINDYEAIHAGIMPLGGGRWFLNLNKAFCKKHGLMVGEMLHIQLSDDTSKYGMKMPEELAEILDQDEVADHYFHALTPGKQRNMIYAVSQIKSMDIRIRRALVITNHLKMNSGKIDFRKLNQEIKESNRNAKF